MVRVLPMTAEDAVAAARLEGLCFSDAWSEESLRSTLNQRAACYIKAEQDGKMIGYCGAQIVLDEGEILRIAVDPNAQKAGIGSALLRELLLKHPDVTVWFLDVRESNMPALRLYSKFDFEQIGIRKKYYHDPDEDAILMQRVHRHQE